MPNGFLNRSLPHFEPYSKYAEAKGFVKNSSYTGLTAPEFFFHTMGGREGLVDTAVKTAETGYMQRRLMKSMEDLIVRYDKTVRSGEETIIQFFYGGDGLDPMFMDDEPTGKKSSKQSPVSFSRLYVIIKEATKKSEAGKAMLTPSQIRDLTAEAIENCPLRNVSKVFLNKLSEFMDNMASKVERLMFTKVTDLVDDSFLRNFDFLTKTQFKKFIELVWKTYERALIQPGEACGAVAAQSIGEPTTQMTLKTFHFAGVASMNVTLGVPRIKEIINATDKISTPIIKAKLVNETNAVAARVVKARIEKTELGDIAEYIKEVYSPQGCYLSIKIDLEAIKALQLEVTIESIRHSILKTGKLKVKEKHLKIVKQDKMHFEPYETGRDKLYFVMQNLKSKLPHVIIKGSPAIQRAVISKDDKDESKYNLAIEGYGLAQVMRTPGIDFSQTKTNHIMEMAEVLGIEAARQLIIDEIEMCVSQYGIQIDNRHVQLLADEMTYKGQVLGITRFGIQKMKKSVLMLASFEMTTDHLYNSAIQCKKDDIQGVTECIVMGRQVPIGTGMFKVCYDDKVNSKGDEKRQSGKSPQKGRRQQEQQAKDDLLLFDGIH